MEVENNPYDRWRKCWENYLLGSQANPDGVLERKILASVDRMASFDLDYSGYMDDSECTVASPFFGLQARALAYRTVGSRYYRDPEILSLIINRMEDYIREGYNLDSAPDTTENWWLFEIGNPLRILDILVLLWDDLENPEEIAHRYTDIILHFKDAYRVSSRGKEESGANLMWKCHILLLTGILRREWEWIDWANEHIPTTLRYSHPMQRPMIGQVYDDGFYKDGSFIQHYMFSYTGGYGKHYLAILSGLLYAFRGQDCLQIPEENIQFLAEMVERAYLPLLYKGHLMDVCRGRELSRYWCEDWGAGSIVLRALLYLSPALPAREQEALNMRLREQINTPGVLDRLLQDTHPSAEYFAVPSLADRLRDLNLDGPEAPPLTGHWNFGAMCKPVHRTKAYSLAISMYSKNIACYERLNLESTKLWHISDGVTHLYTGNGDAFSGNYYATADMQRLPGTTVERSPSRIHDPYYNWYLPEARNVYAFAGGTQLGGAGVAGMRYRGQGNGKERTLEVRKSWFMFEREIVCLGSGISSPTSNPVETIIVNDRLLEPGSRFHVLAGTGNDGLREVPTEPDGAEQIIQADRLFISQISENTGNSETVRGCGYLFPGGAELHILSEHRQGTWNSIEINPSHVSENDFLTVWLSHGIHPDGEKYAYIILPSLTFQEWLDEASHSKIRIEENSNNAHAVTNFREHLTGINFWGDAPGPFCGVECSTQACLLMQKSPEDGTFEIAVSDPTKQDEQIVIRLEGTVSEVQTKDQGIRFVGGKPFTVHVDTSGKEGQTQTWSGKIT